jgi:hypothetical protein
VVRRQPANIADAFGDGTAPTCSPASQARTPRLWKVVASLDVLPRCSYVLLACAFVALRPLKVLAQSAVVPLDEGTTRESARGPTRERVPLDEGTTRESARGPTRERGQLLVPTVHALGLMTTMRVTEAYLWPHPFAETSLAQVGLHYHRAFTMPPRWDWSQPLFREDGDRWEINVIGHGAFGSELYMRARTCRQAPWQALLFTTISSASWEYGFEASGTRPSALDLMFTPAAGLLLGEARYFGWRSARSLQRGPLRSALTALFDPLGEVERALGAPC